MMSEQQRESGVCVNWRDKGGYGFVKPDGADAEDVFVSFREIQAEGFRTLSLGQRVTFERGSDPKGRPAAVRVRIENSECA